DGRFALRCGLPEHLSVSLELSRAGRCPIRGNFYANERPGDLGDLVLWPTLVVQGRLVDAHGAPAAGVVLHVVRESMGQMKRVVAEASKDVTTRADGTFGPITTLPPGRGFVVAFHRVLRGESVAFELDAARSPIELQLALVDDDALPSIRGVVV